MQSFVTLVCLVCNGKRKKKPKVAGDYDMFYCERCLGDIFPFSCIASVAEFKRTLFEFSQGKRHLDKFADLKFNPLDNELKQALAEVNATLGGCKYYDEDEFCKFVGNLRRNQRTDLSLLCHNVRSLPKHKDEFEAYLGTLKYDFDIIGFTETFLNEVSANYATLKDYSSVKNCRKKTGGGVAIYLRKDIAYKRRTDLDDFEDGIF
jgi:hypothetical protein